MIIMVAVISILIVGLERVLVTIASLGTTKALGTIEALEEIVALEEIEIPGEIVALEKKVGIRMEIVTLGKARTLGIADQGGLVTQNL